MAMLGPKEQEWQGALTNLMQRFSDHSAETVVHALRENSGHAGRASVMLRKLPVKAAPGSKKEKAAAEKAAAEKASAEKENAENAAAEQAAAEKVAADKAAADRAAKKAAAEKVAAEKAAAEKAAAERAAAEKVASDKAAAKKALAEKAAADKAAAEKEAAEKAAAEKAAVDEKVAEDGPAAPLPPDSKLIFVAALQGDVSQLTELINAGVDLNARYTGKPNRAVPDKIIDATALHLMVAMGSESVVRVLLDSKADVGAKMRRNLGSGKPPPEQYIDMTALHLAAMEGHASIVDMLLGSGAKKEVSMQLIERQEGDDSAPTERLITPLDVAREMTTKGHDREAVISLLN
mmetsp:Transcript_123169/g.230251  ORF Transcript_123169/g.230251 Transcript_123169/m.230251 type:complete len:349 (-) Transcript_123169:46-1092(-)